MADDGNLVDPILGVAATDGGRPAIEREGTVWSYRELAGRMAAFAAGLGAHGCAPGEVVALVLDDPADGLVGFLGALLGGAVPVQIDPADAEGERARLVALAGARLVVGGAGDGPAMPQVLAAGAGAEAAAVRAPAGPGRRRSTFPRARPGCARPHPCPMPSRSGARARPSRRWGRGRPTATYRWCRSISPMAGRRRCAPFWPAAR